MQILLRNNQMAASSISPLFACLLWGNWLQQADANSTGFHPEAASSVCCYRPQPTRSASLS
eukprot:scaffold345332_cov46-Prasinocladus_malaysianus.AAC.2